MRRSQRLIALAVLIALSGALAGCGGGGISSFDPSDLLDFLDTKKKLPGERKPVFPEGVPGLEQGVPKDFYKGSRQQQIDQQNAQAAAAARAAPGRSRNRSAAPNRPSRPAGARDRATPNPMPRRGRGQHRRGAAGSEAEDRSPRAPPHRRPIAGRSRRSPRNNPRTIPGADAERHASSR